MWLFSSPGWVPACRGLSWPHEHRREGDFLPKALHSSSPVEMQLHLAKVLAASGDLG